MIKYLLMQHLLVWWSH